MIYTQEGHVSLAPGALEEVGRGKLKKKKEKGTERGKGCVCDIQSDQHSCFLSPWTHVLTLV